MQASYFRISRQRAGSKRQPSKSRVHALLGGMEDVTYQFDHAKSKQNYLDSNRNESQKRQLQIHAHNNNIL